jgi:hypothetical protein
MRKLVLAVALGVGFCGSACGDDESGSGAGGSAGVGGGAGVGGAGNASGSAGSSGAGGSTGGAAGTSGGGAGVAGAAGSGGIGGAAGADAALSERRVFVSSTTLPGNFGGITAGDAECQKLANQASLGGQWKAWVGDGINQGPSTTFVQSSQPYVLVGGGQIAADWADLTDLSIDLPIDRDENGNQVAESLVWTGVSPYGSCCPPSCNGFTTTSGDGMAGNTTLTQPWGIGTFPKCTESHRLYCFEQ